MECGAHVSLGTLCDRCGCSWDAAVCPIGSLCTEEWGPNDNRLCLGIYRHDARTGTFHDLPAEPIEET
jgi:hypothetical protein